jgi:hypothetical protein
MVDAHNAHTCTCAHLCRLCTLHIMHIHLRYVQFVHAALCTVKKAIFGGNIPRRRLCIRCAQGAS